MPNALIASKQQEKVYTLSQAKEDAFAKNPEVKRLYDLMEEEYKLKEQLIEARLSKGLHQNDLALLIDTKQSAISRYEKGDCFQMSIRQLYKIAHAMGKKVEIKLGVTAEPPDFQNT